MSSIGSTINIAKTALRTQQEALNVTAHNIANAANTGYARQRAVISANRPLQTFYGSVGTGVGIRQVQRIADPLLDMIYRRESGSATENETRGSMLARVETIFGEPSDLGVASLMDRFFSSWSELASNPTSDTVRSVVRQQGTLLAGKLNSFSAEIDGVRQEIEDRLVNGINSVNRLTTEIADLNRQIVTVEADGGSAPDMRDARAGMLNQLAQLMPIQVHERQNGAVGVTVSGVSIVDLSYAKPLEVRNEAGVWGIDVVGSTGLFPDNGGEMGGLLSVLNTEIPAYTQALDDIAAALVAEVNAAHNTGTNPLGATGVDFFDAAGTTASSIGLSAAVLADAGAIAAGTPDGTGGYRAGATDVALTLAGLRETSVGSLGATLPNFYAGLVSDVGQAVRSTQDAAEARRILSDAADMRRQSLSGVAVDEELVQMIEFQTAYQAAARIVTTVDEMLQTLLNV
jgi:flagellar hook-associated protein 1 FlgK